MATQIPPRYVPVLVACVASVSVRFRSKERERESKWRSFHFSRGQSRESRSSVLLCSETKRKRLRRRLLSRTIISTLRTVRLVPMNIKWHLCDVNARPYCFAILGMRGSFDSIFLGISVARKLETYRKSSNKQSPHFQRKKANKPPIFFKPPSPPPQYYYYSRLSGVYCDCKNSFGRIQNGLFTSLRLRFLFDPRLYIL